ncbi:MAG: hypothetical protein ACJAVT_001579 [Yoonia sp.]|jgi:uncharacterized protein YbjQ (UPF0145 family)
MLAQKDSVETPLREQVIASQIIMTTEAQNSFKTMEHLSIVSAQCAFGARVSHDIFASVQDVVDGRSKLIEQTMNDGVELVLFELKKKAFEQQADAVVGISIQYTPIGYASSNMILISGVGTAVRLIS